MSTNIAVALEGAGWHPAAWREPDARPRELFTAGYWRDLVEEADRGGVDLVTIEDSFGLQTTPFSAIRPRTDRVQGRLDALLIASFVAPTTRRVGLVPTVTVTHTEPFHVATALQTLDFASRGRAGWRVQVSASADEARHFGRREVPALRPDDVRGELGEALVHELFDEATEVVEAVRRLWDSWEDDAIIRDVATGRFVDRDRLHYADFLGERFSIKGPSITPRSPQGQPLVVALAHDTIPFELAARSADIVFLTPGADDAPELLERVRAAEDRVGRVGRPLDAWADVLVLLEPTEEQARTELERLDELAGARLASDAIIFAGTPAGLIDRLRAWSADGFSGFRLRPARLPHDLNTIIEAVVPVLAHARPDAATLREHLGHPRPASRYTSEEHAA